MKFSKHLIATALSTVCAVSAFAQNVSVTDAWARATVQGQKATGAFMKITAKDNAKLVGVSSPVAGVAEIHEMKMDKDVMRMNALPNGLDLPAGKAVELKPGGYHVMFLQLTGPFKQDSLIPVVLKFEKAGDVRVNFTVKPPTYNPGSQSAGGAHGHGTDMKH